MEKKVIGNVKTVTIPFESGDMEVEIMRPRVINSKCYRMSFTLNVLPVGLYLNNVVVSQKGGDGEHRIVWPNTNGYNYYWFHNEDVRYQVEKEILKFYGEITGTCEDCEERDI